MWKPWILIAGALLIAPAILAHDCHEPGHHHYDGHDCYGCGRSVQPARPGGPIRELSGTVAEIRRPQTDAGVLEVWLKTGSGTVLVRLAPPAFLRQNGLAVREGEGLAVRGYDGGPEGLFTATEIERDGKPLSLRSSRGKPLW